MARVLVHPCARWNLASRTGLQGLILCEARSRKREEGNEGDGRAANREFQFWYAPVGAQSPEKSARSLQNRAGKTLPGVRFIHGTSVVWKLFHIGKLGRGRS